ncbi:MAG: UDP-3-O-(3-hydroxymyristoyl)glucosamine N-acyltransferase [Gammaproteobacteria bacterium]
MTYTLATIAGQIDAELRGEPDCEISALATLETADAGQISFLANRRYLGQLRQTRAAAVILAAEHATECPVNALIMENPYLGYALTAQLLYPQPAFEAGIHASASVATDASVHSDALIAAHVSIGSGASIGADCYIGPGCIIGAGVKVGTGSRLLANVTLMSDVNVGARVIIHPGAVIGADGFGLAERSDGSWLKIPQVGSVIIGDDVEIGANTTIDRGALDDTVICRGVKIDNQVQIGHNVFIDEYTAVAGCTGIAGSVHIGKRCRIGGGCGISGHLEIVDDVMLTAMSGVNNSIKTAGVYSSPLSVTDNRTWRRNVARFHRLDETLRSLRNDIRALDEKK